MACEAWGDRWAGAALGLNRRNRSAQRLRCDAFHVLAPNREVRSSTMPEVMDWDAAYAMRSSPGPAVEHRGRAA